MTDWPHLAFEPSGQCAQEEHVDGRAFSALDILIVGHEHSVLGTGET